MPPLLWMTAVSYLEWIRWLATGRLRCTGRIVALRGFDDQEGFDALLGRMPDLNFEEEQGFLIAVLLRDALQAIRPVQSGAGLESVWVPITCVEGFYPVTERGQRMLEADAARANVRLEKPLFADLWMRWQHSRREEAKQHRSEMLCSALGLPRPLPDRVSPPVVDLLTGRTLPSTADKAAQLRGSSAYAWALTFGIFGDIVSQDTKSVLSKKCGLGKLLERLERSYPISKPVTGSEAMLVTMEMSRYLHDSSSGRISVVLLAVVLHYQHLLVSDRPVSLESMLEDLVKLGADGGVELAALAAYFIAPFMEDVAISTLMYQASPASFLAMKETGMQVKIDVGARIDKDIYSRLQGSSVENESLVKDYQFTAPDKPDEGSSIDTSEGLDPPVENQFLNNTPNPDSGNAVENEAFVPDADEFINSSPAVRPDPIHGTEVVESENIQAATSSVISGTSADTCQPEEVPGSDATRSP